MLLAEGKFDRVVALKGSEMVDYDFIEASKMSPQLNKTLLEVSAVISQ